MCSDVAIRAESIGKTYRIYDRPVDRLRQLLFGGRARAYFREFPALTDVTFELKRGEALGLVGRNGAGKSTLLQVLCGTLTPSSGSVSINGRIAALLELGAGFNPDFSGRENVYLNAALLGLSTPEIDAHYDEIVAFADIGSFIDQPVKTYSSGMYVRLAFAIATSVQPDILVIDEALSVGDGAFARKSFDRIMRLREQGATVLFCSHSMFHIESICDRAMWLDGGRVMALGEPASVVPEYEAFLSGGPSRQTSVETSSPVETSSGQADAAESPWRFRLRSVQLSCGSQQGRRVVIRSRRDELRVQVEFSADPSMPAPSIAVVIHTQDHRLVCSAGTWNDGVVLAVGEQGLGRIEILFPNVPLLKGHYTVGAILFCERGLHAYDEANHCAFIDVTQDDGERGIVSLPHRWVEPERPA